MFQRFSRDVLAVTVPLLLVAVVLFSMPSHSSSESIRVYEFTHRKFAPVLNSPRTYAVIFDAGSSGSRVHVYCFDHNMELLPVGNDLELFRHVEPGLSSYASSPTEAANSLIGLLDEAESAVPKELRPVTPVKVGATAGLRSLEGDTADRIMQAVRDLLETRSTLHTEPEWVTILDGSQEGSYLWMTVNYLLGNLGKTYPGTVGVVDLGGGSVQMAYAISESAAANAPKLPAGVDPYVKEKYLKGRKYYLYVHSYLNYGLLAARAEILKVSKESGNPCILAGYQGSYTYGGIEYQVSAPPSGTNLNECRGVILKALSASDTNCPYTQCTFGGVWNGGGGDGQANLYVGSFFFDREAQAGFISKAQHVAAAMPEDFKEAAKRACETKFEDMPTAYPAVYEDDRPYLCMDLAYQYTLLVDGFGLRRWQNITLVKQVKYGDSFVEAAWPLGSAIEVVSSLSKPLDSLF